MEKQRAIVISASSDIGTAMCERWLGRGWQVFGTYRTMSPAMDGLTRQGGRFVYCDVGDSASVSEACRKLHEICGGWDVLVLAPGTQEPVGPFSECDFDEWAHSLNVNFVNQLRIVRALLADRNMSAVLGPCVLFFAGGGTNSATVRYSAYTISKIALVKMTELLDAELGNVRFVIVGPGWVKTKIHEATLRAGALAGANFERTQQKLASDELTPMEDVLECCEWLIRSPRNVVSGRNFSVVFDMWGTDELAQKLSLNPDLYKLRRYGNDLLVKGQQ